MTLFLQRSTLSSQRNIYDSFSAPTYITKINDFSSDVSEAALTLGTEIVQAVMDGDLDLFIDGYLKMHLQ